MLATNILTLDLHNRVSHTRSARLAEREVLGAEGRAAARAADLHRRQPVVIRRHHLVGSLEQLEPARRARFKMPDAA